MLNCPSTTATNIHNSRNHQMAVGGNSGRKMPALPFSLPGTINSKINVTPKRCLLVHFEAALNLSRRKFTCHNLIVWSVTYVYVTILSMIEIKMEFRRNRGSCNSNKIFMYFYAYQYFAQNNCFVFIKIK